MTSAPCFSVKQPRVKLPTGSGNESASLEESTAVPDAVGIPNGISAAGQSQQDLRHPQLADTHKGQDG